MVPIINIILHIPKTSDVQSSSSDNCLHHYNVKILNLFNPELLTLEWLTLKQRLKINWKNYQMSCKSLKFRQSKKSDCKVFDSSAKLIASDSDNYGEFKSMYQSIITKIKRYAREDWIVLDVIVKHSIKIFEC